MFGSAQREVVPGGETLPLGDDCFTSDQGPGKDWYTSKGLLHLRTRCPAARVETLELDSGLGIFWNFRPDCLKRQKQILLNIARNPQGNVTLACDQSGTIVGYVLFCPPSKNERWGVRGPRELLELGALEVSRRWRGLGIIKRLLRLAFADPWMDDKITFTMGFCWHWDLAETGMTKWEYRKMLMHTFSTAGLEEYATDEPNIRMDPANFLMARAGPHVPASSMAEFIRILFRDPDSAEVD